MNYWRENQVGHNDLWIAATAMCEDAVLVTSDGPQAKFAALGGYVALWVPKDGEFVLIQPA